MSTYKKLGQVPLSDIMPELQTKAPELFKEVASRIRWDAGSATWDSSKSLPQALAQKLDDWLVAQVPPEKSEPEKFREESAALAISERKRLSEEREAQARLDYWKTQGLEDNEHNANAVANFIKTHSVLKSRFTAQAVDIAIDFLGRKGSNVLQWQQNIAVKPAAKPVVWKAGDPLPDNATNAMLRASSVSEVKAWRDRQQR
jgi:hypothetical protein